MFAIGVPGYQPRVFFVGDNEEYAAMQLLDGEVYVAIEETGDYVITEDGLSVEQRVKSLDELRAEKWRLVKDIRNRRIGAGVTVSGRTYDSDSDSRANVQTAAFAASVAASMGQPFEIRWTLKDNTFATLTGAEIIEVCAAGVSYVSAIHERARVLRTAIETATTVGELDALDIEEGWPQ